MGLMQTHKLTRVMTQEDKRGKSEGTNATLKLRANYNKN